MRVKEPCHSLNSLADANKNRTPDKKCTANSEKYSAKIENHVKFLQNILELYPVEEKPPHCKTTEEEAVEAEKKVVLVKTVTDENGKARKQYTFDAKTDELALPKISILTQAKEVHEVLLKEFEKDARKAANLKKPDPPAPAPKEESEEVNGPKKLPSESQKNKMKAEKEAKITKKDHSGLVDRTERLKTLLKTQTDRVESMQVGSEHLSMLATSI